VLPGQINVQVVVAALLATILWSGFALWRRIPVSISQALFGGLLGAAWIGFGLEVIQQGGLVKILIGLFLSPLLGLAFGYILVQVCYTLATLASPHVNVWFQRGQVAAAFAMAVVFGSNDGQKMAGVLSLGLATGGLSHAIDGVDWLLGFSALAIALGTLVGGWRLIHTMGGKFYKIQPIHGFGAQIASASVLFGAGLLGWPVSGAQVMTSTIVGAGSADRLQKVRWGVVQQIMIGWALTIPASGLIGALFYLIIIRGAGT
jgi:PiT family inorganic phosphate transporter